VTNLYEKLLTLTILGQ